MELASLITRELQAARAIVRDPALLAAFREQRPDLAGQVEAFARQDRGTLIAQALRNMPQPSQEPEPDPEPPSFGMRM